MSDSHQHEPGMDEILASIRRIISEDAPTADHHPGPAFDDEPLVLTQRVKPSKAVDPHQPAPAESQLHLAEPAGTPTHAPLWPVAADSHEPSPVEPIRHVFDTHNPEIGEPPADAPEAHAAIAAPVQDALPEETEILAIEKQPASAPEPIADEETVKGAASSLDKLSDVVRGNNPPPPPIHLPPEGRTLEDLMSDLLKPMLKAWLDENLPAIVEARVDEEVERITRRRVR